MSTLHFPTSRREFLQLVAGAVATKAAVCEAARSRQPGEKLRLGLFGLGDAGMRLLRAAASQESCEVAFVCEPNEARLAAARTVWGRERPTYEEYRSFWCTLMPRDCDAWVIASPDHLHAIQIASALRMHTHVLVCGPLCNSYEEWLALRKAWHPKVRLETYQPGFALDSRVAAALGRSLQQKEFGDILRIHGVHVSAMAAAPMDNTPVREREWQEWLGGLETTAGLDAVGARTAGLLARGSWRAYHEFSFGPLAAAAAWLQFTITLLEGKEVEGVASVTGGRVREASPLQLRPLPVGQLARWQFGEVEVSWHSRFADQGETPFFKGIVETTQGTLTMDACGAWNFHHSDGRPAISSTEITDYFSEVPRDEPALSRFLAKCGEAKDDEAANELTLRIAGLLLQARTASEAGMILDGDLLATAAALRRAHADARLARA